MCHAIELLRERAVLAWMRRRENRKYVQVHEQNLRLQAVKQNVDISLTRRSEELRSTIPSPSWHFGVAKRIGVEDFRRFLGPDIRCFVIKLPNESDSRSLIKTARRNSGRNSGLLKTSSNTQESNNDYPLSAPEWTGCKRVNSRAPAVTI